MEEKDMKGFYLLALFLVTGFCFLSFTVFLSIINELNNNTFLWIGVIFFGLGVITGADMIIYHKKSINKKCKAR